MLRGLYYDLTIGVIGIPYFSVDSFLHTILFATVTSVFVVSHAPSMSTVVF
jgi:phosphohistidine phosphatase SixA